MTARILIAALLLLAGCGGDEHEPPAAAKRTVARLQEGGLTLVIRHGMSDAEINRKEQLGSCALQRNLTKAGRRQADEIGKGVRALHIPIGDVRASPLCRARDTARLAFGRVTIDRDLVSPGVIGTEADDRRRAKALRALAEHPPPKGKNTVLVTHTGNIGAAFGGQTTEEGEMLVYGPGAKLVGRIRAEEWAALADMGS